MTPQHVWGMAQIPFQQIGDAERVTISEQVAT